VTLPLSHLQINGKSRKSPPKNRRKCRETCHCVRSIRGNGHPRRPSRYNSDQLRDGLPLSVWGAIALEDMQGNPCQALPIEHSAIVSRASTVGPCHSG